MDTSRSPVAVTTRSRHRHLVAAGLLIGGGMVGITAVAPFHPSKENPNDHPAVFACLGMVVGLYGVP
jgi:hypothetical protein